MPAPSESSGSPATRAQRIAVMVPASSGLIRGRARAPAEAAMSSSCPASQRIDASKSSAFPGDRSVTRLSVAS